MAKVTVKAFDGLHHISKTGLNVKLPNRKDKLFFGGYGCSKNKDLAERAAYFEAYERALSTYYPVSSYCNNDKIKYTDIKGENSGESCISEWILGPTPWKQDDFLDAVGLCIHSNYSDAKNHAVLEVLERHILAKIWYLCEPIAFLDKFQISPEIFCCSFTVTQNVPFVFTITYKKDLSLMCLGSAFSKSLEIAQAKSLSEAVILMDDRLNEREVWNIALPETRARMLSQQDKELNTLRFEYLHSNITQKHLTNGVDVDIFSALGLSEQNFYCATLFANELGTVVRVKSHTTLRLQTLRKKEKGSIFEKLDLVC